MITSQLGWVDFSPTHRSKVMSLMDMFKEQGVVDELGLGTIRDAISDKLFPGTSTIQTRAKYFLLIPWIIQDIEQTAGSEKLRSEIEESEVQLVSILKKNSLRGTKGIIGIDSPRHNAKRKPSSIYWNGLKAYGILNFNGSLGDYINYQKHYTKKIQANKMQLVESDGNVQGDDRDANHFNQQYLWCSLPKPIKGWKENLTIELTLEEATYLKERIIRSNPNSLWAFTLKHCAQEARTFSSIDDFLFITNLSNELKDIIQLASDFNRILQGALIRYNLLIQQSRQNGRTKELEPLWKEYCKVIKNFDWNNWNTEKLWKYCPFTPPSTKLFVERWISLVQAATINLNNADNLIKDRELRLKGIRRARLQDKAVAQKQETITGITVYENGMVSYLTYRWNNVRTFLNDIQEGLANNVTTK